MGLNSHIGGNLRCPHRRIPHGRTPIGAQDKRTVLHLRSPLPTRSARGATRKRTLTLLLGFRGIRPIRVIRVEKSAGLANLGEGIIGN